MGVISGLAMGADAAAAESLATVSAVEGVAESTAAVFFTEVESAFPTLLLPVLLQFMARLAIKNENPKAFNLHPPGYRILV